MRASSDHILTSQAGSLPRPDDLIEANNAREAGKTADEAAFQKTLEKAVVDVVRRQKDIGIDVPGDGEFGKSMGHKVNYRAWWSYCFHRLGGLDLAGPGLYEGPPKRANPGEVGQSPAKENQRKSLDFAWSGFGELSDFRGLRRPPEAFFFYFFNTMIGMF